MPHLRIAFALAVTVAIGPFALDTYLPAFPAMAADLGVSVHDLSLTVAVYIAAMSAGQLVGGPLADRFGKQPVMLLGFLLFIGVSIATALISSMTPLLILRGLQAFGAGWVIVCVPALVRDKVRGNEAARLFSLIGLIVVAAPAVAPAVGSLLLALSGWRGIFVFLAVYAAAALAVCRVILFRKEPQAGEPETEKKAIIKPPGVSVWKRYLAVLRTPSAVRLILLQASIFSVMMLFVTHASFIYQGYFEVSAEVFAGLFAGNILSMWLIMVGNRWLLRYIPPATILRGAVSMQAVAVATLLAVSFAAPILWLFAPALMLCIGAIGATSPNCQACYMENFGENGGTAAALMGATQFGVAGAVSAFSSFLPETLETIVLTQAGCALVALALAWWPVLRRRRHAQEVPCT